jgi:hypothetical protein
MAVVAGTSILPEAAALARQTQVWQVTDGQAIQIQHLLLLEPPQTFPSGVLQLSI